jgi:TIR domain-containing protein
LSSAVTSIPAPYQHEIDRSIEQCRLITCLLTPNYFRSPECLEELDIARLRNKREEGRVLVPIYWQSCPNDLALWLQTLNLSDLREMRTDALPEVAHRIVDLIK